MLGWSWQYKLIENRVVYRLARVGVVMVRALATTAWLFIKLLASAGSREDKL